eukprot:3984304-Alexandrium_andersonii.AAC.1
MHAGRYAPLLMALTTRDGQRHPRALENLAWEWADASLPCKYTFCGFSSGSCDPHPVATVQNSPRRPSS